jgi:hypothetical protein
MRNSGLSSGVESFMHRLCWFDRELDDGSAPIDWHLPALTMATLFLNFPFWYVHGDDLPMFWPLPVYACLLGVATLLITALFFVGPALAMHTAKRSLSGVVEDSLGSISAFGFRICYVLFLVLWMASLIAVTPPWPYMSRWDVSSTNLGLIVAGILVFVFFTGVRSLRTRAKLAWFSNRLGIAILIAALFRVHEGLPAVLKGFPIADRSAASEFSHGFSLLAFYVAPLALLAASLGYRNSGRKQVAKTALMGIVLPLFGTLLFVGVINVATGFSPLYQPSLNPNVAMALWAHAAHSYLPGPMMVVAITMFGPARFGASAVADFVSIRDRGSRPRWVLFGCLIGAIAWASLHSFETSLSNVFEMSARCLAVTGAVLTADVVVRRREVERVRRFDGVGVVALLAGLGTPLYLPSWIVGTAADSWWHPWLLPSYGVGFAVCVAGRALQKAVQ